MHPNTANLAIFLKDILTALDAGLKDPEADKQRIRRARAHVESAYYILGGSNSETAYKSQQAAGINVTVPVSGTTHSLDRPCTCPPGTRNRNCTALVHTS